MAADYFVRPQRTTLWSMIANGFALLFVGIIAGYAARLLVPGRDNMGFLETLILGIGGSLIGGLLGFLIFRHDYADGAFQTSGLLGSIIGAIIALLAYRVWHKRDLKKNPRGPIPPPSV